MCFSKCKRCAVASIISMQDKKGGQQLYKTMKQDKRLQHHKYIGFIVVQY